MVSSEECLKIFIPPDLVCVSNGLLLGWQSLPLKYICVLGYIPTTISKKQLVKELKNINERLLANYPIKPIGLWLGKTDYDDSFSKNDYSFFSKHENWLVMELREDQSFFCTLLGSWQSRSYKLIITCCDFNKLLSSQLLGSKLGIEQTPLVSQPNAALLLSAVKFFNQKFCNKIEKHKEATLQIHRFGLSKPNYLNKICALFSTMVMMLLYPILFVWNSSLRKSIAEWSLLQIVPRILSYGATGNQLLERYRYVKFAGSSHLDEDKHSLMKGNIVIGILLDAIAGVFLILYIMHLNIIGDLCVLTVTKAEVIVSMLQDLLHWLMGVPVGLKLNHHLSETLGQFFLYHIYLWKTYIDFVRPFLHLLLQGVIMAGWLGLSFQLSMLSDLFSMLTFHVYCFYVYAARLYSLQLRALSSLWRLFRGKKWNVLRLRVDSCSYDVDQLLIGNLLFIIMLFLLPTTLVYYIVFACLRLVVLAFQSILSLGISLANITPFYTLILRILGSDKIRGEIHFEVMQSNHNALYLLMTVIHSSFITVIKETTVWSQSSVASLSCGSFLMHLITGKLLYQI